MDDLCSFDVDLCTLIKDGDATSCGKASERKRELLAAMHPDKAKLFETDITELLCCRHYGKNTTKLLQRNWKKTWDAPKGKTCGYFRGTINKIISSHKGDADGIKKRLRQMIPHLSGDHTGCDDALPCRSDAKHEQTLLITNKDTLDMLAKALDERCDDEKIRKLQWDITTNGDESLNADLTALHPKRLYCKNGARYDNYSLLVPLRRICGMSADVLILQLMGFPVTSELMATCESLDQEQLKARVNRASNKRRRKQIRKMRAGWDKKSNKRAKKAGFKCKDDAATNKPSRRKKRKRAAKKDNKQTSDDGDSSDGDRQRAGSHTVSLNVVEDNVSSESDMHDDDIDDMGASSLVDSRAELLRLQRLQEEFMREVNAKAQSAGRAARLAARSKK